jgi:hypothetical protein
MNDTTWSVIHQEQVAGSDDSMGEGGIDEIDK